MTPDESRSGDSAESRRCPYCGCSFTPSTPDQVYCWPGCEAEDRKRREAQSGTGGAQADGD